MRRMPRVASKWEHSGPAQSLLCQVGICVVLTQNGRQTYSTSVGWAQSVPAHDAHAGHGGHGVGHVTGTGMQPTWRVLLTQPRSHDGACPYAR